MANGNVSIQPQGGGSTIGVIPTSGTGVFFPTVLYRYANLTLPYGPNDPGLTYTYNNSTLAPVVLLYARFFNLLNESSQAIITNVGTTAFVVSGAPALSGASNCLDVRAFGAVGDGVTDDTAAIQAALNQAYQNYLGNQHASSAGTVKSQVVQSLAGNIGNGAGTTLLLSLPVPPTVGNTLILSFTAFDYGGSPTVTDNAGNTYTPIPTLPVVNGQYKLYMYTAPVTTAALTTISIKMTGLNFNSFISGVATEFTGLITPVTVDGVPASTIVTNANPVFAAPNLLATNHGDLVLYMVENADAAGLPPTPPGDFTLINTITNQQPNSLNGALPVLSLAYKNWSGTPTINSSWTGVNPFAGAALLVAFKQVALPPAPPGKTAVCIQPGVNCMVSPVAFDHPFPGAPWNTPAFGNRYSGMAYSLVMNDGVTLIIDGSLIANPNANQFSISGSSSAGNFGWALITNSAWLQNTVIGTQLVLPSLASPIIPWSTYLAGTAFNEGPRNTGIKITGAGQVYLHGDVQAASPGLEALSTRTAMASTTSPSVLTVTATPTTPTSWGYYAFCGFQGSDLTPPSGWTSLNTPLSNAGHFIKSISGTSPVSLSQQLPASSDAASGALAIFSGILPTLVQGASGSINTPGTLVLNFSSNNTPGNTIIVFVAVAGAGASAGSISVTDTLGNAYRILANVKASGPSSTSATVFVAIAENCLGGANTADITVNYNSGAGGVREAFMVELSGVQSGLGQLAPTALARFYCADNSTIETVEVVAPFMMAVEWGHSTNAKISNLYVHDAPNTFANIYANSSSVRDSGIFEMDMLRNSSIVNNTILNCPASRAILDWAGYQNAISGNTITSCFTGYEYRDAGGEWAWVFGPPNVGGVFTSPYQGQTYGSVTHNSQITQNKILSCVTASSSVTTVTQAGQSIPVQTDSGSDGFGFNAGWAITALGYTAVELEIYVTGTSFHDNIANGNTTDIFISPYMAFQQNTNNSSTAGGPPPVVNGVNIVGPPGETPSGAINGANTIFTILHAPIAGTVAVFINGLQQASTDFTVSGKTITLNVAPNSGSQLAIQYQYLSGN